MINSGDVIIRLSSEDDVDELRLAFERSEPDIIPWIFPPKDIHQFAESEHLLLVCSGTTNQIIGYFRLSNIIRGPLQQAFLGFCVFSPNRQKGFMSKAFPLVLDYAFNQLDLHRIEANIQPENTTSIRFVARNGFRKEGFSPDYLYLNGAWKDHERWAMNAGQWAISRSSSNR